MQYLILSQLCDVAACLQGRCRCVIRECVRSVIALCTRNHARYTDPSCLYTSKVIY